MIELLWTGPSDAAVTLLLAHGAGAPMDSAFMTRISEMLAAREVRIARFEFTYMAARRTGEIASLSTSGTRPCAIPKVRVCGSQRTKA